VLDLEDLSEVALADLTDHLKILIKIQALLNLVQLCIPIHKAIWLVHRPMLLLALYGAIGSCLAARADL